MIEKGEVDIVERDSLRRKWVEKERGGDRGKERS